jgi:hypothetical protein
MQSKVTLSQLSTEQVRNRGEEAPKVNTRAGPELKVNRNADYLANTAAEAPESLKFGCYLTQNAVVGIGTLQAPRWLSLSPKSVSSTASLRKLDSVEPRDRFSIQAPAILSLQNL